MKYNQGLSEQRALSVRDYRVERIESTDGIVAVGSGEWEPIVESYGKSGQALIECLAPNRRVEIDADVRTLEK